MVLIVIIFSMALILMGLIIVIKPNVIFNHLKQNIDSLFLYLLAVVIRGILGIILIIESNTTKFPVVIEVVGWVSLSAAIILIFIGRNNFKNLMVWGLSFAKPFARLAGVLVTGVAVFLLYAFI